jgi:hypothetical protein
VCGRLLAVAVAAVVLPAGALAKGPDYALLSGPGIDGAIRIDGDGESGIGTPLGALATYGGYGTLVFGHHPNQPTTKTRPAGTLGPRYRIVYSVPTPSGRRSILADLYPFATPRPLTYMKPGQPFHEGMTTQGGWYAAPPALKTTVVRAGVPDGAEGGDGLSVWPWVGGAGALALGVVAVLSLRRRPQPA